MASNLICITIVRKQTCTTADSEVEESETWIAELQSSFSEAMEKQVE